jgi:hypothetical protein
LQIVYTQLYQGVVILIKEKQRDYTPKLPYDKDSMSLSFLSQFGAKPALA